MSKNTHLEHVEDDIIIDGKGGGKNALEFLKSLGEMMTVSGTSTATVTTKWDGAPAIVCGVNPLDGRFFVGTKSVFNKTNPKVCTSDMSIDFHYPGSSPLNRILKNCLKILPKLGISGVVQGDYLYDSTILKTNFVDGESCWTFNPNPNSITYVIPKDSPLGDSVANSKIGIAFHTYYTGDTIPTMSAVLGFDARPLQNIANECVVFSAIFEDNSDQAKFSLTEKQNYVSKLRMLEGSLTKAATFLGEVSGVGQGRFALKDIWKEYMNTFYRDPNKQIMNTENTKNGFVQFYKAKLDQQILSLKMKSAIDKYIKIQSDGLKFLKTNDRPLYFAMAAYKNIIEAKQLIIKKLEIVKTIGTFVQTENGFETVAPEGFVAISASGRAVKLVSRLEFSRRNFSSAKSWEKG